MSRQQLIEYLRSIILLETAIRKYIISISLMKHKLRLLALPITIPIPVTPVFIKKDFKGTLLYKAIESKEFVMFPLAGITILSLLIKYLMNVKSTVLGVAFILTLLCVAILTIITIFQMNVIKKENENSFVIYRQSIQNNEEVYRQALEADRQRVLKEQDIAANLSDAIKHQEECLLHLNKQLTKLYEQNVIYTDFRGLISVSYLYKYLASGITDKLEGPEGAYAQYLQDERTNRIIHKIDEVIGELDSIMIYQEAQISILTGLNEALIGIDTVLNANNINLDTFYDNIISLDDNVRKIESGVNQYYQRYTATH